MGKRRGFTLVDLLVTIAVMAVVLSIVLPALAGSRYRGRVLKCHIQLGGVVKSAEAHRSANRGMWPVNYADMEIGDLPGCPLDPDREVYDEALNVPRDLENRELPSRISMVFDKKPSHRDGRWAGYMDGGVRLWSLNNGGGVGASGGGGGE